MFARCGEGSVDLTPGLWFGELCVRHNEGSQIGVPEPHRMYALVFPEPFCDGLPTFHTDHLLEGEEQIHLSNGTVRLLRTNTGWHGNPIHQCTDRSGPYNYLIEVVAVGDWVLRLGKADLPFEVGTHAQTSKAMNDWIHQRYEEISQKTAAIHRRLKANDEQLPTGPHKTSPSGADPFGGDRVRSWVRVRVRRRTSVVRHRTRICSG